MGFLFKQNAAFTRSWYLGATSLTPALLISKNGAAFTNPAAGVSSASEVGAGWYKFDFQAADSDTLGLLAYSFGSGQMSPEFQDEIVGFDPLDPTRLGLAALPNSAAGSANGLPVLNSANCVNSEVIRWFGGVAPALVGGNVPAFVADISTGALGKFFITNSGQTYGTSVSGSVVKEIAANSGGGGGDPLNHLVPGTYGAGTAGFVIGTNLDATIKSLQFYLSEILKRV